MKVFRVEHPSDGVGPYHSSVLAGDYSFERYGNWTNRNHEDVEHPSPRMEKLPLPGSGLVCGFVSLEQLKDWFNEEELQALHSLGFQLVVYEVYWKDVHEGRKQCVFKRTGRCERLTSYGLLDLESLRIGGFGLNQDRFTPCFHSTDRNSKNEDESTCVERRMNCSA